MTQASGSQMRGVFVTGTDTGVGKTVVAAALAAALRARGERVATVKPVLTGADEPADPLWPPDDELLGARVARRFGPPVSPHLAAELAGAPIERAELMAVAREAAARADIVVIEGVGGILVPLTPGYLVRDYARELGLPLVVAARPGLGTINHTLLTLEAARAVALEVRAVVLTPWPEQPSVLERSNHAMIERLGAVRVLTLRRLPHPDEDLLAAAGAHLVAE
jgi:dethiobiotin synthetase